MFVLLLCGIGAISAAGGGDGSDPVVPEEPAAAVATSPKKAAPKRATPGIGAPVKDGDFQFTVTGMKCGVAKVGNQYFGEKAQGQFCLVSVQVKNVGDEAQTLIDSVQKAFDAKGTEYSVDSGAAIYANEEQQVFFEDVNPGNTVRGKLVFDVPKGTKLTTLELHDSMFSGGVKVALK
ncbi:DUF4352 domain-containing protein [Paractinoplanes lichenicola]|uniref:DUF4352 domain-containing protein n=1 Tax=Paractinoplanes lichenicola TaxID=2802976 RepID=UPI0027DEA6E1|nr:DUF4352 domain-containing protein [Actinoplanes lichenicola]